MTNQQRLGKKNYDYCEGMVDAETLNRKYCCNKDKSLKGIVKDQAKKVYNMQIVQFSENGADKIGKLQQAKSNAKTNFKYPESLRDYQSDPNICPVEDCITLTNKDNAYWGEDNAADCMCKKVKQSCNEMLRHKGHDDTSDCELYRSQTGNKHICNLIEERNPDLNYYKDLETRFPNYKSIIHEYIKQGKTVGKYKPSIIEDIEKRLNFFAKNILNELIGLKIKAFNNYEPLQIKDTDYTPFKSESSPGQFNLQNINYKLINTVSIMKNSGLYRKKDREELKSISYDPIDINDWIWLYTKVFQNNQAINSLRSYLMSKIHNNETLDSVNQKIKNRTIPYCGVNQMSYYSWLTLFPEKKEAIVQELIEFMNNINQKSPKSYNINNLSYFNNMTSLINLEKLLNDAPKSQFKFVQQKKGLKGGLSISPYDWYVLFNDFQIKPIATGGRLRKLRKNKKINTLKRKYTRKNKQRRKNSRKINRK